MNETAAGELASELARMHGAMFNLIVALYKTQLSPTQAALVSAADVELAVSQRSKYTQDAEIERLATLYRASLELLTAQGRLLGRAADALEFWMKDLASTEQQYVDAALRDERLIAELRKEAN
jgi:hypothetical protein